MKSIVVKYTSLLSLLIIVSFNQFYANDSKTKVISIDSTKYVDASEFTIAGFPRYTIDGSVPTKKSKLNPLKVGIIATVYTGFLYGQYKLQSSTIWKPEDRGDFHIQEDGDYALYVDKFGHFYGTYLVSYCFSETLMLTGLSYDAATIWGSLMGLGYNTYVEIQDGHFKNWGFSPSDFYADIVGAGFHLAQHYYPILQNFTPKFMYFPSTWHGDQDRKEMEFFIDNYNSQTFWLSVNVHNLLPKDLKDYWPKWLELSFGYAARNVCTIGNGECDPNISEPYNDDVRGNPKFIIALDYNLVHLLPKGPAFWNWLRQSLNLVKLPSPAIEFGKETKFYLVYPFHF